MLGKQKLKGICRHSADLKKCIIKLHASIQGIATFAFFVLSFTSNSVYAGSRDFSEFEFDLGTGNTHISWLPGEAYDTFSGRLEHQMVDLEYEGNGSLPIRIIRRYTTSGGSGELREMSLVIPRISFVIKDRDRGGFEPNLNSCRFLSFTGHLESPLSFDDGIDNTVFYPVIDNASVNTERFSAYSHHYVSADNWMLRCSGPQQLEMRKPNGDVYTFIDPFPSALRGGVTLYNYRVQRITDKYGNWIEYDYDFRVPQSNPQNFPDRLDLRKIFASDGREVNLTYNFNGFGLLARVESNASPKPHIVRYVRRQSDPRSVPILNVYHNDSMTEYRYINSHTFNATNGLIESIEYPTGARVNYEYGTDLKLSNISKTSGNRPYPHLVKRRVSERGIDYADFTFDYQSIGNDEFARIVKNPEFMTEFRYKKGSRLKSSAQRISPPSNITANDGQLVAYKVFDKHEFDWYPTKDALLKKEYNYEIVSTINDLIQHQDTNLVALKSERTELANSSSLSDKVSFEKYYYDFDEFGFPRALREVSSDGSSRRTGFTYKYPNEFDEWIVGLQSSVNVDSGDSMHFNYNSKGSVTEQRENGIPTYFDYFISATGQDQAHGELKTVTDAENGRESYWYYKRGVPSKYKDKSGRITHRGTHLDGTLAWETRPGDLNNKNRFYYDKERRLRKEKSSRASTQEYWTSWSPDRRTRQRYSTDNTYLEKEIFDAFGRTVFFGIRSQTADDSWRSTVYAYNDIGQQIYASLPFGEDDSVLSSDITSMPGYHFTYDSLGRVIGNLKFTPVENSAVVYRYDTHNGQYPRITSTDRRGNSSHSVFKSYGEPSYQAPIEHKDENGTLTTITRDKNLRVLNIRRNNVVRRFVYNDQKQLSAEIHPEYGRTDYLYYSDGMLEEKNQRGGRKYTRYTYTPNNELSTEIFEKDGVTLTRTYTYDNHANLVHTRNLSSDEVQSNEREIHYDTENNVITERLLIDGKSYEIRYLYDGLSNLSEITYPYAGGTYSVNSNAYGDATSIVDSNGKSIFNSIAYNDNGSFRVLRTSSGRIFNTLDDSQRINRRSIYRVSNGSTQGSINYRYDQNSNILARRNVHNQSTEYGYDAANRLTSANIDNRSNWTFGYTPNDNIDWVQDGDTFVDYTYHATRNILTEISAPGRATRTLKTDAWGNIYSLDMYRSEDDYANKINRRLTFNPANQVVEINNGSSYEYDSRGLRVRKSKNGDVYTFYDYENKLRYRHDKQSGTESAYFYVNDQLVARRDLGSGEQPQNNDGSNGGDNNSGRPAEPTDVTAAPTEESSTSVRVSWNEVGAAEKYNVNRNGDYLTTVVGLSSFVDTGLAAGLTYSYTVVSVDEDQQGNDQFSGQSAPASVTLGRGNNSSGRPAAPTGVTAMKQGSTSVHVRWNAVGAAEKYNVNRNGAYIATVVGSTSFVDTGLAAGSTYSYTVVSVDEDQQGNDQFSAQSAPDSITLDGGDNSSGRPAAPTGVTASPEPLSGSVLVRWSAVGAAEKYNVNRNGEYIATVVALTSFVDTGRAAGQTYSYTIVSVDDDQQGNDQFSAQSAPASITLDGGTGSNTGGITVSGNSIVIPGDGWYQFQIGENYNFWQGSGGQSVEVANGTYTVINHSTGTRYENITVPQ